LHLNDTVHNKSYTILVNSTDSFEDCWAPFFTLLKEYWPDCRVPIVLNTETKDFRFPGLDITCSKVGSAYTARKRPPWGWCLRQCLGQIQSDIILYMQEDYFLEGQVDHAQIAEFVRIMSSPSWSRQQCSHIGLTHFGSHSPFHLTEYPLLWEIDQRADYRVSLQAGLWKTASMLRYIEDRDTGWSFEETGSARARRIKERLLTVNRHVFNPEGRLIFPYTHTGIIRGKWNREAVEALFAEHKIPVEFSVRGFHIPAATPTRPNIPQRILGRMVETVHRINLGIDRFRSI